MHQNFNWNTQNLNEMCKYENEKWMEIKNMRMMFCIVHKINENLHVHMDIFAIRI
jgi:hypothetical protein